MTVNPGTFSGWRVTCLLGLAFSLVPLASTWGCSVPVFRYALERWQPSAYELVVAHHGALSPAQESFLAQLRGVDNSSNAKPANITVRTVDLSAGPGANEGALWRGRTNVSLPAISLRAPSGAQGEIWSGPLTGQSLRGILDSPLRQRIVQLLRRGETAVWVFLESGDRAQDDTAATVLKRRLEYLQKTLQLPTIDPNDLVTDAGATFEPLKVGFSLLRLARNDPAEEILIRMLLSSEEDLSELKGPLAFPIFGRGRILYALAGEGINAETIDEACSFLVGPCSCIVKEENPGFDLLISAAWDRFVRITTLPEQPPPELTGLTATLSPANPAPTGQPPAGMTPSNTTPDVPVNRRVVYIPILIGGVVLTLLAIGTVLLRRKG